MNVIKFNDINTDDKWVTKNTCGIYMIENLINNKKYIGQSKQIRKRWISHTNRYNLPTDGSYSSQLYTGMRKYGFENFKFSVLEECEENELDEREAHYIKVFDTFKNGYNGNIGGLGSQKFKDEEFKEYFLSHPKISVNEMAKIFKIDRSVAGRKLKSLGLKSNWAIKEEEKKRVYDLYVNEKMSMREISEIVHRDRDTVSKILKEYNVIKLNENKRAVKTHRSKRVYVYDTVEKTFINNLNAQEFKEYLYDLGYKAALTSGAVVNHIKRKRKLLYDRYIVRYSIKELNEEIGKIESEVM